MSTEPDSPYARKAFSVWVMMTFSIRAPKAKRAVL